MKKVKLVRRIVVGVLAAVVILLIIFAVAGDGMIRRGVEKGASKTLDVPVTVGDLSLSLFAGSVDISDLDVANPEGFETPTLLEMGNADVDLDTPSLFSDTVTIDTMNFDDITLTIEQKGLTNNLKTVLDNLPKSEKGPEEPTEETKGKNLLIKKLTLSSVKVRAKLLPVPGQADTVELKLAPIEMEDLGTEDKMSVARLSALILTAIAEGVAQQAGDLFPADMVESLKGTLEELPFEQGQKLLEDTLKLGEDTLKNGSDAGKDIMEKGKDIGEGLKGLFDKKEDE
ncbi:putative protein involved in outer membrane biogenesis [Anaerohalosphaera lusitana]|uniref:AsmA domain-containing protein n=1 Tax=Anaerohalosphaera lusitana TaxID=1936003 RepID=A0A1U9NMA9_9BACT|nr:hypothetical protein [Anaerohalosphaera lusitana]AQT69061.1 putative protein involved in outer membrane biogenesis [Anaerohalosphaera lusitana]